MPSHVTRTAPNGPGVAVRSRRSAAWVAVGTLSLLGIGLVATLAQAASRVTFDGPDWPLVAAQPDVVPTSLTSLFDAGSLTITGGLYRVLLPVWGLADLGPYVEFVASLHVATALLMLGILYRRGPLFIAFAAAAGHLLCVRLESDIALAAVGMFAVLPLALGLGAIWVLDRPIASRWMLATGGVLIVLALLSGPVGLPVALAAVTFVRRPNRLPLGALPVLVAASWLVLYGGSLVPRHIGAVLARLHRFLTELGAAALGLPEPSLAAALLCAGLIAILAIAAWPPNRLVRATAIGLSCCLVLVALRPEPISGLYVHVGRTFTQLLIAQLAATAWISKGSAVNRAVIAAAIMLWAVLFVVATGSGFWGGYTARVESAEVLRTEAAAISLLPAVPHPEIPLEAKGFAGITLGEYIAATRAAGGSPAISSQLSSPPPASRELADRLLFRALGEAVLPLPSDARPPQTTPVTHEGVSDMTPLPSEGECLRFDVGRTDPFIEIEVPRGIAVSYRFEGGDPHQVFYRFFAEAFQEEASYRPTLESGMWYRLKPPQLAAAGRSTVRIDPPNSSGPFEVCFSDIPNQPQFGNLGG